MKNLIVLLAVVLVSGAASAFAKVTSEEPRAEKAFAKQFAGAENVKWTKLNEGYQKATFTLNGIRAEAFFDKDAQYLGSVRNLFYNQLPMTVMQTIGNKFTAAAIIEVKEVTNNEGTSYRVVLEQNDKMYKLKLNSLGEITEQQKGKIKR